jgi:hypothetical protein
MEENMEDTKKVELSFTYPAITAANVIALVPADITPEELEGLHYDGDYSLLTSEADWYEADATDGIAMEVGDAGDQDDPQIEVRRGPHGSARNEELPRADPGAWQRRVRGAFAVFVTHQGEVAQALDGMKNFPEAEAIRNLLRQMKGVDVLQLVQTIIAWDPPVT